MTVSITIPLILSASARVTDVALAVTLIYYDLAGEINELTPSKVLEQQRLENYK